MFATDRAFKQGWVHPSKENYQPLAESIVAGCTNRRDRVRAIYAWICKNIEYDTTYTIYHADECYAERRGVCQAYCELFHYIAKCVGIRSRIISGISKSSKGKIGLGGHAWLYVDLEGWGMLLDPTWGAGHVEQGLFTRNSYIWSWYDVDPRLMVMSHLPEQAEDQFIASPISHEEFEAMIPASSEWATYRLDIERLFHLARRRRVELPELLGGDKPPIIELIDIPLHRHLNVGRSYSFRIKLVDTRYNIALINYRNIVPLEQWQDEGDGVYHIRYTLQGSPQLNIACNSGKDNRWSVVVSYHKPTTTEGDIEKVDNPLLSPEFRNVGNLQAEEWRAAGLAPEILARLIREQHIQTLPAISTNYGDMLRIVEIPMHYHLKRGESYTFKFYPNNDSKWAIIESGKRWHFITKASADGMLYIDISPSIVGPLYLMYNSQEQHYISCITYEVVT